MATMVFFFILQATWGSQASHKSLSRFPTKTLTCAASNCNWLQDVWLGTHGEQWLILLDYPSPNDLKWHQMTTWWNETPIFSNQTQSGSQGYGHLCTCGASRVSRSASLYRFQQMKTPIWCRIMRLWFSWFSLRYAVFNWHNCLCGLMF